MLSFYPLSLLGACIIMFATASQNTGWIAFRNAFDPALLESHGVYRDGLLHLIEHERQSESLSVPRPHLLCGPHATLSLKLSTSPGVPGASSHLFYTKKSLNVGCVLVSISNDDARTKTLEDGSWVHFSFPRTLKLHQSILAYLSHRISKQRGGIPAERSLRPDLDADDARSREFTLAVEYFPFDLSEYADSMGSYSLLTKSLLDNFVLANLPTHAPNTDAFPTFPASSPLIELLNAIIIAASESNFVPDPTCNALLKNVVDKSSGFLVEGIEGIDVRCLSRIVTYLAATDFVMRLSIDAVPTVASTSSSSSAGLESVTHPSSKSSSSLSPPLRLSSQHSLYSDFSLTGRGQVVGLADTGIDSSTCFLGKSSNGNVDESAKIIEYISFADNVDDEAGHGTHMAGILIGDSSDQGLYEETQGLAKDSKISFFDIGVHGSSSLLLPRGLSSIFSVAYKTGARLHADGWGAPGNLYSILSIEVDAYTALHPDFLVVLAAGNAGASGKWTVGNPGTAKNALTVGATQSRNSISDAPIGKSTLAYFSSLGPTADGRLKPDLVAPGYAVLSARSSTVHSQLSFLTSNSSAATCALHELSGTSMAVPVVSAAAAMLREFFTSPDKWAAICDRSYSSCIDGSFEPSGYLLKAALLHSGEPLERLSDIQHDALEPKILSHLMKYRRQPTPLRGYGYVYLRNLLPSLAGPPGDSRTLFVKDGLNLLPNQEYHFVVETAKGANGSKLKATIAWYDPPSVFGGASSLLVNDVDLFIMDPKGEMIWGNGVTGGDDSNPNEQIDIDIPSSLEELSYIVVIRSSPFLLGGAQSVGLVITTTGRVIEPSSGPFTVEPDPMEHVPPSTQTEGRLSVQSHGDSLTENQNAFGDDLIKGRTTKNTYLSSETWEKLFISSGLRYVGEKHKIVPSADDDFLSADDSTTDDDYWGKASASYGDDTSAAVSDDYVATKNDDVDDNTDDWNIFRRNRRALKTQTGGSLFWSDDTSLDDSKGDDIFSGDDDTYKVVQEDDWATPSKDDDSSDDDGSGGGSDDTAGDDDKDDDWHLFAPAPSTVGGESQVINTVKLTLEKLAPLSDLQQKNILSPQHTVLGSFSQQGRLSSISLDLHSPSVEYSLRSFVLVVTDPLGIKLQIGGPHKWAASSDRITVMRWPKTWPASGSAKARRNVRAASLSSPTTLSSDNYQWTVEVVGPCQYEGSLALEFDSPYYEGNGSFDYWIFVFLFSAGVMATSYFLYSKVISRRVAKSILYAEFDRSSLNVDETHRFILSNVKPGASVEFILEPTSNYGSV